MCRSLSLAASVLCSASAHAATLTFPANLSSRSFKWEWYGFNNGTQSKVEGRSTVKWNYFHGLDLEFWSGVLECERVNLREHCSFANHVVHHGYRKESGQITGGALPLGSTLVIQWSKNGYAKRARFEHGGRAFRDSAVASALPRYAGESQLPSDVLRHLGRGLERTWSLRWRCRGRPGGQIIGRPPGRRTPR